MLDIIVQERRLALENLVLAGFDLGHDSVDILPNLQGSVDSPEG